MGATVRGSRVDSTGLRRYGAGAPIFWTPKNRSARLVKAHAIGSLFRVFRDQTAEFPIESENQTLLVSPDDKAVGASEWLHQHDRVGIVPPIPKFAGIETVEVTGFRLLEIGHGYFLSRRRPFASAPTGRRREPDSRPTHA